MDAKGPDFFLSINGRQVSQVTDPDYTEGQIGFYVRSIDSKQAHIHFDQLIIRDFEAPPPGSEFPIQYQDDFTNKGSGWPTTKIDTYLFGYHEPDWYDVEVDNPNTIVPIIPVPQDKKYSLGDATIELDVNTFPTKTAPDGDFRYGTRFPAFRGQLLCLYHLTTHEKMVSAQKLFHRTGGLRRRE